MKKKKERKKIGVSFYELAFRGCKRRGFGGRGHFLRCESYQLSLELPGNLLIAEFTSVFRFSLYSGSIRATSAVQTEGNSTRW